MMADGVQLKFLQAPLTQDQLAQIVQIGSKAP
jgi:NitT/TauT family transport system substrate-binding protein